MNQIKAMLRSISFCGRITSLIVEGHLNRGSLLQEDIQYLFLMSLWTR